MELFLPMKTWDLNDCLYQMEFVKYQGTGNDFILILDENKRLLPHQIKKLCHRRYGVGADGVILFKKENSLGGEMFFFNSDGIKATMCGNGLRCLARHLFDEKLFFNHVRIKISGRYYEAFQRPDKIEVDMGKAHLLEETPSHYLVDSGVLHFITFKEDLNQSHFLAKARQIRYQNRFAPFGVNVNFVKFFSTNHLEMRTYEKGVEDETLSCGTGAMAACIAAWKKYGIWGEIHVRFRSKEMLRLNLLLKKGNLDRIYMSGDALKVFKGTIEL